MNHEWAKFQAVLRVMEEQRRARRKQVRSAVAHSDIPLSLETLWAVAGLNPAEAREVLRSHPGFPFWEKRRSYEISLSIFWRASEDLLSAIERFEEAAHDQTLFDRARQHELEDMGRIVQKELFATANAAHSLVDHSRRLQKIVQVSDYRTQRAEWFKNDGLHEFLIGLRTLLHHLHILPAGWQYTQVFGDQRDRAVFKIDRDEFSIVLDGNRDSFSKKEGLEMIVSYLGQAPKNLDIRNLIEEYRQRADNFHKWFAHAIDAQPLTELRDYERCIKENKNNATRLFWRAMLGNWLNWDKPPNPYNHLHRYLTSDQMEEVYRLPKGSKEQVDRLIELVDIDGACNDEIRELIYQLFRRACS